MAGVGRDGLRVELEKHGECYCLHIERDGGERFETWATKADALARAAALMVQWHSEEVSDHG